MNKQHILNEIKRTAEENGGLPLGLDRFSQETGIKYDDWFGKYWARWSDAVKEAGFSPNKFVTEGYGEPLLIQKYAALIRELGRVPVRGEIGLKCRTDKSFPSETAFRRCLGSKANLLAKLREYCSEDDSLADVLALLPPLEAPEAEEDKPVFSNERCSETGGFVYLMKAGRYYKIGRTNSLGRREYELAIQLPEKARKVHLIKAIDDASGIEAYWHKRFEAKRTNGEWFELDAADVQAFKRRRLM
jgi:hypothetical protein